jgi:putative tRNA adenosine deaminase-associated protein
VTYFAVAVARTSSGWSGQEVDLAGVDDIDALADLLRDEAEDADGPALLLLEEDDEYVGVVRVDGDDEPRVFLSDRRSATASGLARPLAEAIGDVPPVEEEGTRPAAEPLGDPALLDDLGISSERLLDLCAEEGMLPADVMSALGEDIGFLEVLERARGA